MRLLVAVIAFIFAVWQTYLAKKQLDEAKQQTNSIITIQAAAKQQTNSIIAIQGSLSTKSIGEFPAYMPDLINLIKQANSSITIACDYVITACTRRPISMSLMLVELWVRVMPGVRPLYIAWP